MKIGLILVGTCLSATLAFAQKGEIDSLLRIVAKHPRDTVEMMAFDRLSGEFMRSDMDKARDYALKELALAKELGHIRGMSRAYATIVPMHQTTGRLDSAQYYLDQYEILNKRNPSNKRIGINYANTTGLFYKNQGRYKEALPYLLEALKLIGPDGDKTNQAGQSLNIGNTYHDLGDLKSAATYHLRGLTLFEEVKNKLGQSFCLQSLGADFLSLEQYAVAENYFLQADKLKEELGDSRGLLTSWMSLGEVYQRTNKPVLSMLYSEKALKRARELKLTVEEFKVLFNIGILLKSINKPDEATRRFNESMVLARQAGDSLFVSRNKSELIMMEGQLQKEKKEQTLIRSISVSLEKGDRSMTAEGHQNLAKWYADHKQFEKAFESLKLAQQVNDSVRGSEVILQLNKLEEEFKSEKKEREIALLKKDQELKVLALSRQKVIIASIAIALVSVVVIGFLLVNRFRVMNKAKRALEMERMRNTIARDLHDDIGSALSSIHILSQVAQVAQDGNPQNYLQRIGDQSARIMENMGDMVWSINPGNDSMEQVIIRMREFVTEIMDPKNIEYVFVEEVKAGLTVGAEARKNLFLIFKEAVNNAAKYSNATRLDISLRYLDHRLILRVKDNGQGFDGPTARAGNGLRNMRERATESGGTIGIHSVPDKGTEVELELPLT